ncbi:MAG: RNA replicase beta chain [Sanya fiers-like virus 24]|nr:MAG: RNA replicase beta chain [Sanya fiers-like virus 24]
MPKQSRLSLTARTFSVELGTFLRTCECVNTPRALTCYLLAVNGEWDQYLALPAPDTDSPSFADDYLVSEVMRKNPNLTTSYNPREEAVKTWWDSEERCARTNEILVAFSQGGFDPLDRRTKDIVERARRIVSDILGPLTRAKLDYAESQFRFGPGATSVVSGSDVIHSKKYMCSMHITPRLYPYWRTLCSGVSTDVSLRAYSKVTFVPKTAKTDRAIAIEPHLNIFVQLGIGALLRQRLKRYGLNLDHQADVNRRLASVAHIKGLATVDLSAASDTIAYQLIWLLLPFDWAALLDLARTEYSVIDGKEVRLSKFSSMGNGYTFELETLLFLALARASGDPNAVTFGDDIIIDRNCYPALERTLDFLGFSVNKKKTFTAGRFFESCGHDYHDGKLVRPFYLKGSYHAYSSAVIRICNKVRRYSHMRNGCDGCDVRFLHVWRYARRADVRARSTYISLGYGDSGLIVNFDEACPAAASHGHEGFVASVLRERVIVVDSHSSPGALAHALHRGAAESVKSHEMTRRFRDLTRGNQVIPQWYNLGPWKPSGSHGPWFTNPADLPDLQLLSS